MSRGQFSGDNSKPLVFTTRRHVPIFEGLWLPFGRYRWPLIYIFARSAKMSRDLRLVWTVDLRCQQDLGIEIQEVRVLGIWNHKEISKKASVFRAMVEHPSRIGSEFIHRRTANIDTREGTPRPQSFDLEIEPAAIQQTRENSKMALNEEDLLELHDILT